MNKSKNETTNIEGMLKAIMTIASAELASITIRIIKAKLIAVLLGPAGTGLLSILANFMSLTSMTASIGLPQSGVRELAGARQTKSDLPEIRKALALGLSIQGVFAMTLIWTFRKPIANLVIGEQDFSNQIALVGAAVMLSMMASAQQTILRGLRHISDLGKSMVIGTAVGAIVGIAAIWTIGETGLAWILVAETSSLLIVSYLYARRLVGSSNINTSIEAIWKKWKSMAAIGLAFTFGGFVTTATLMLVRVMITRELGLNEAGIFAAAWAISGIYFGFILQSMGTDLFPRLSEVSNDSNKANDLINNQIQIGVAIGAPIIIAMIGMAPWLVSVLYTQEFADSATLVQWLAIGDIIKLAGFSYGFYLIAVKKAFLYSSLQVLFNLLFAGFTWLLISVVKAEAAAIASTIAYILSTIITIAIVHKNTKIFWQKDSVRIFCVNVALVIAAFSSATREPKLGAIMATIFAIGSAYYGAKIISKKIDPASKPHKILAKIMNKPQR